MLVRPTTGKPGRKLTLLVPAMLMSATPFCMRLAFGSQPPKLDLGGAWGFQLDPDDRGRADAWFSRELEHRINLPGSMQAQGFGAEVALDTPWIGVIIDRSYFTDPRYAPYRAAGGLKVPFWLQPPKYYAGAAWYQREIIVPPSWAGKRIRLSLERPHWGTTVWVDAREIGSDDSLSTPHEYDLTALLRPGHTHRLTLRVDNRMLINVGPNAHSVADHTQTNWNGVVGALELMAEPRIWFDDVRVYPDVRSKRVRLAILVINATERTNRGKLSVAAEAYNTNREHRPEPLTRDVELAPGRNSIEVDYSLGPNAQLWDEFSPVLYRLSVRFTPAENDEARVIERTVSFGLRQIGVEGTQLTINGRKTFLRGTLECCIFPLTGYPPTDVASWRRIVQICKGHGLNHIRFHSWCPPEAAFQAADELGFYYQVECSSWPNQGAEVGSGRPIDEWLIREGQRIIRSYGNHPSFIMMASGNEPAGPKKDEYLTRWVEHFKRLDPRRKYTSAAGWPILDANEFHLTPKPRLHQWGDGLRSRLNAKPPATMADYRDFAGQFAIPVVSHEIGQWCVYPNFEEIPKYTGVLKPLNFEIFRDFLRANHMGDQARDLLMASGKWQTACYKEEIESALRTPGMGGFQLLDLHDFPGQGTALVGVLDAFWDSKPYVTPAEYRRFAGETVPLARMVKRVFTSEETFRARIEVAHFGPTDFDNAPVRWKIADDDGNTIATGTLQAGTIPRGELSVVGEIKVPLEATRGATRLNLDVSLDGTGSGNDWDIWSIRERSRPTSRPERPRRGSRTGWTTQPSSI